MSTQTLHGWIKMTAVYLLMANGQRRNIRKLSYLQHRNGWWIKLQDVDGMIPLSDPSIDQVDMANRYANYVAGSGIESEVENSLT